MGVNTFRFKLWAFVIGAAIGGLSGALYAGQVQYVAPPTFNIINSMLFLCAVVLGGQGNKLGRDLRRVHHRLPAQPAAGCGVPRHQPGRLEVPVLRARAGGADDLPARGSVPGSPATAGLRQGGARSVALRARARRSRPHDVRRCRERRSRRGTRRRPPRDPRRRGRNPFADRGSDRQVRRADRTGFGHLRHPPRRDPRHDRAQRRRQDHLLQRDHRRLPAQLRLGDLRRRPARPHQAPPDHPKGHRPHVPEHPAVRRDDRAGERHGRHRRPAPHVGAGRARAHPAAPPRGEARRSNAPRRCCTSSASPTAARRRRRTCPTATSGGSRSPARWPPNRSCCASTNRPPGSTRARRRR